MYTFIHPWSSDLPMRVSVYHTHSRYFALLMQPGHGCARAHLPQSPGLRQKHKHTHITVGQGAGTHLLANISD